MQYNTYLILLNHYSNNNVKPYNNGVIEDATSIKIFSAFYQVIGVVSANLPFVFKFQPLKASKYSGMNGDKEGSVQECTTEAQCGFKCVESLWTKLN